MSSASSVNCPKTAGLLGRALRVRPRRFLTVSPQNPVARHIIRKVPMTCPHLPEIFRATCEHNTRSDIFPRQTVPPANTELEGYKSPMALEIKNASPWRVLAEPPMKAPLLSNCRPRHRQKPPEHFCRTR